MPSSPPNDSSAASNEARYREAFESLQRHFPEAAALIRELYNRGMVKGLRCLRYVKTPDDEWGRKP